MLGGQSFGGKRKSDSTSIEEAYGMYQVGKIDHDVLEDITELCCPTVGPCQHMATANSICCMAEALGLSLPGSAAIPAVYNDRIRAALLSGEAAVRMVLNGITSRDILTPEAIRNAIMVLMATGGSTSYGLITIFSTMAWGLGYFGMPHILLRFMAIENEDKLKVSRRIASIWVVISMFVAILIGMIGYSVSKTGSIPLFASSSESETVIIRLADLLSRNGFLTSVIAGVVLAGILACTMSTADSQLLTAASGVSQNLLQDFLGIKMSAKASMMAARLTVTGIALVAILLAWNPDSSVFTIVSFAWAGFGAAFGPVMLFALFWKRSNLQGALAGMISGGVMVFVWKYGVRPLGGAWNIYELLPAFIVASVSIVAVSLATAAPSHEVCAQFDSIGDRREKITWGAEPSESM